MLVVRYVLVPLALATVIGLTGCTPKGSSEPIVLGHLAPLSGPDKLLGDQAQHGIELAVDEVNRPENRINGQPVNVVHADTAGSAEAIQAQTVRLVTTGRVVALLGGLDATQLEHLSRALQPYSIPLVSPATLVGVAPNDYVFSTTVTPAYQGQILARFAREVLKPAEVLLLTDSRSNFSSLLAAAFRQEVSQGNTVRVEEDSYKAESEFAELVKRVKKGAPHAILVAGAAADVAKLRPLLQAASPGAALLCGVEEGSLPALAEDRTTPGPAYLASVFAADALTPKGQEVAKQYRDRYGRDLNVHAALAYDNARLLFEALRKSRSSSAVLLRKELLGLENFETITGPFAFTKERTARRPLFLVRLEEGRAQLAKRYDPEAK
jgi:branched-chain amino acid transport system substrate-binding protein